MWRQNLDMVKMVSNPAILVEICGGGVFLDLLTWKEARKPG